MDTSVAAKQPQWLEKPVRISEQKWPEGTKPVVSIFCITYNHEKFIQDAIEGFLMQETTFPVEIFIHDDASTDGTAEIVKKYAAKFPKLFWAVLQTENQWSKGNKKVLFDYLTKQRGEYIAFCEGDDCWILEYKLQKQVELLQKESSASLVFHNVWVRHKESSKDFFMNHGFKQTQLSFAEYVEKGWFIATTSMVFRNGLNLFLEVLDFSIAGDIPIQLALAFQGKIHYLDFVGGVYRIHETGISFEYHNKGDQKQKLLADRIWVYWNFSSKIAGNSGKKEFERYIILLARLWLEPFLKQNQNESFEKRNKLFQALLTSLQKTQPKSALPESLDQGSPLIKILDLAVYEALAKGIHQEARDKAMQGDGLGASMLLTKELWHHNLELGFAMELFLKVFVWTVQKNAPKVANLFFGKIKKRQTS